MKDYCVMMAGYNRWANARLYDACARLPDADYRADRGAFFGSLNGTLNHLLVGDRIWLQRFTGAPAPSYALDTILHDNLSELRIAREAEDDRIIAWVDELTDTGLGDLFRYRRASTPDVHEQVLWPVLVHFFNHQTHHRGQAHAILTGLTADAPPLDLLYYQRETRIGGSRRIA